MITPKELMIMVAFCIAVTIVLHFLREFFGIEIGVIGTVTLGCLIFITVMVFSRR
jgi:hypothetical protein